MTVKIKSAVQKLEKFLTAYDKTTAVLDPETLDCVREAVAYPKLPRELLVSAIKELRT